MEGLEAPGAAPAGEGIQKVIYCCSLRPEKDHNGAFFQDISEHNAWLASMMQRDAYVHSGAGVRPLYQFLKHTAEEDTASKIDLLIIRAHGRAYHSGCMYFKGDRLCLNTDELKRQERTKFEELLRNAMNNGSQIVLESCSAGNKSASNFAEKLSKAIPQSKVFAFQKIAYGPKQIFQDKELNVIRIIYNSSPEMTSGEAIKDEAVIYQAGEELTGQPAAELSVAERVAAKTASSRFFHEKILSSETFSSLIPDRFIEKIAPGFM